MKIDMMKEKGNTNNSNYYMKNKYYLYSIEFVLWVLLNLALLVDLRKLSEHRKDRSTLFLRN